jgi:hypothetical protein
VAPEWNAEKAAKEWMSIRANARAIRHWSKIKRITENIAKESREAGQNPLENQRYRIRAEGEEVAREVINIYATEWLHDNAYPTHWTFMRDLFAEALRIEEEGEQ